MKFIDATVLLIAGLAFAGCAGSVSAPVPVQSLAPEQRSGLSISSVVSDAADGVPIRDDELSTMSRMIKTYMQANNPGIVSAAGRYTMKVHFTRFDRGDRLARMMLMGLGQIRIEATVDLCDAAGSVAAEYKVSKDFAGGGIWGGATDVSDVEDGFAKSVAEIVKAKA
jgi:hypothetical protein